MKPDPKTKRERGLKLKRLVGDVVDSIAMMIEHDEEQELKHTQEDYADICEWIITLVFFAVHTRSDAPVSSKMEDALTNLLLMIINENYMAVVLTDQQAIGIVDGVHSFVVNKLLHARNHNGK